jgi:hypothetical protein
VLVPAVVLLGAFKQEGVVAALLELDEHVEEAHARLA